MLPPDVGLRLTPRHGDEDEHRLVSASELGWWRCADRVAGRLGGFRVDELSEVVDGSPACVLDVTTPLTGVAERLDAALLSVDAVQPRLRLADGTRRDRVDQQDDVIECDPQRIVDWSRVLPAGAAKALTEGITVILNDVAPLIGGEVLEFTYDLSRLTGVQVQVNAYLSERDAPGFGQHWDDHDVIILQVRGRKRWELFHPAQLSPMLPWCERDEAGDSVLSVVLEPGMGLFIPRGWPHAVQGFVGELSLHLTVGIRHPTMLDLFADLLTPRHIGQTADSTHPRPCWEGVGLVEIERSLAGGRARLVAHPQDGPIRLYDVLGSLERGDVPLAGTLPGGAVFADVDDDGEGDVLHLAAAGRLYRFDRVFVPLVARLLEGNLLSEDELLGDLPAGVHPGARELLALMMRRDLVRPGARS